MRFAGLRLHLAGEVEIESSEPLSRPNGSGGEYQPVVS